MHPILESQESWGNLKTILKNIKEEPQICVCGKTHSIIKSQVISNSESLK